MDAAGGAVSRMEERSRLRLRRGVGADPVESVIDTFLGTAPSPRRSPEAGGEAACDDDGCGMCPPEGSGAGAGFKPLRMRCPRAASVVIGVEPSGRVCLEVRVGGGASVGSVLGELQEAEQWLRSSAHQTAMAPVWGRMDMSQPIRRRVMLEAGAEVGVGSLARAGVEVRGGERNRRDASPARR